MPGIWNPIDGDRLEHHIGGPDPFGFLSRDWNRQPFGAWIDASHQRPSFMGARQGEVKGDPAREAGREEERRRPRNQDTDRTNHQRSDGQAWFPIRARTIAWRTQSLSFGRTEAGTRVLAEVRPG